MNSMGTPFFGAEKRMDIMNFGAKKRCIVCFCLYNACFDRDSVTIYIGNRAYGMLKGQE
jgi:hypothetical protein